jgi:hypothetical protein
MCASQDHWSGQAASVGKTRRLGRPHSLVWRWLAMRSLFPGMMVVSALIACRWAGAQVPTAPPVKADSTRKELLRAWSAPQLHSWERAEAVNRHFTNGTPVSTIVAVLGTNFTYDTPYSSVWIGPGPERPRTIGLEYRFGDEAVIIGTSALLGGNGVHPLKAEFTRAGYAKPASRPVEKSGSQHNGAAKRSQPVSAQTNRTPAAAASRRSP